MDDRLPDSDRDLRLARRLEAGEAPDGSDPLHDALAALRPEADVAPEASARLWGRIAARTAPRRAPDRAPARGLRRVPMRTWALAASVVVAVGLGVWLWSPAPTLVAAAEGEVVRVALGDGSEVALRPHSRLVHLGEGRAYRLEGEALFAVASDPQRPFTVEADGATVRVLGTRFVVSTWGTQTDVFVEEGRVEVSGDRTAVVLGAGEAASVVGGRTTTVPDPAPEAATDWLRGEAAFDRVALLRVADEIGQHFGVVIRLPEAVRGQTVSGVLSLDSEAEALDGLGRILGGRFVPEAGGYRYAAP